MITVSLAARTLAQAVHAQIEPQAVPGAACGLINDVAWPAAGPAQGAAARALLMCGSVAALGHTSAVGGPSSAMMRPTWSSSLLPGNSTSFVSSSAMMQPRDQTSMGVLYSLAPAHAAVRFKPYPTLPTNIPYPTLTPVANPHVANSKPGLPFVCAKTTPRPYSPACLSCSTNAVHGCRRPDSRESRRAQRSAANRNRRPRACGAAPQLTQVAAGWQDAGGPGAGGPGRAPSSSSGERYQSVTTLCV